MIIIVYHNKQKVKIQLQEPSLEQLYRLVQENLKLPFDFELRDKSNQIIFNIDDQLEVFVVELNSTTHELPKSKTVNDQYSSRKKRDRINSLNMLSGKKYAHSEFSTPQDNSEIQVNKREIIISRMQQDKQIKEEQQRINKEGNKLIQQIKKRIQLREQVLKMREDALNMSELEKKKIILAQKRELSQPIRLDFLAEHQKKYEDEKMQKLKAKEQQKIQQEEEFKLKLIKFPKSQALVRLEEEQAKLKISQQQSIEQKKLLREKQLKYGESIKDSFLKEFPRNSISPIKNSDSSNVQSLQLEIAKQNIQRLQNLLGEQQVSKLLVIPERRSVNEIRQRGQHSAIEIHKNYPFASDHKPQTTDHINNKIQKRRILKLSSGEQVHGLSQFVPESKSQKMEDKYHSVLSSVMMLEQRFKEREKKLVMNKQSIEDEEDNKYLQNIRAKLELLN